MPNYMKNTISESLIVTPYLDNLGGGERYMLSIASALEDIGHSVYFSWDSQSRIEKIATDLNIHLKSPKIDSNIKDLYISRNFLAMFKMTRKYDHIFYLSDGSIPLLGGKKNYIHFQVPFRNRRFNNLKNKIKLSSIHKIIVNSKFTKKHIDSSYQVNSTVLYPPVKLIKHSGKKSNIILSLGRFESSINIKRQDVLIEAFIELEKVHQDWKLVLAGSSTDTNLVKRYKNITKGHNIEIHTNINYDDLQRLYSKSSIYWSATGYDVDENKNPELTEHFGISIVEAASAGSIPLFIPKGGTTEIIPDSDFHWNTIEELVNKTKDAIFNASVNQTKLKKLDLKKYEYDRFKSSLIELIQ